MKEKLRKAYDDPHFIHSREARPIRVLSEYLEPEKRFKDHEVFHTVVFFGSARLEPDHPFYKDCEETAYQIAEFSKEIKKDIGETVYVCTGGGPGIMEAANRGADRAKMKNIGLNISLPFEQEPNPYITPELNFEFHYFFMRKLWFLYQAKAILIFPGGFGTLDELFETLTLIQTKKLEKEHIPILLYNREFWESVVNFDVLVEQKVISPEDIDIFEYFETPEECLKLLKPRLIETMKNVNHYLEMKMPV